MTNYLPYAGDILTAIVSKDSSQREQALNAILQIGTQAAWDQARPELLTGLPSLLGKGDLIGAGWTLYDLDLRLAEAIHLVRGQGASSVAGAIPLQMRLAPNLLIATSTTPSVFGSDFDPRFSIDFGIVVDFTIVVVPDKMLLQIHVGAARVTGADGTGDPHLDSQNLVADLADALATVAIPFFGGPNYVQMVESIIGRHDFAGVLNHALQPVNDQLGQLAAQGMGAIKALFPDASPPPGLSAQSVNVAGPVAPGNEPLLVFATTVTGDGIVRGAIHWPKTEGRPDLDPPFVGAFTLSASVNRGAAEGQFAQATDVTHLGGFEVADSDTEYVARYSLVGLPTDEPITIECTANGQTTWIGSAAGMVHSPERDGWSGLVTVHPSRQVAGAFRPGDLTRASEMVNPTVPGSQRVELNPQPIPPGRGAVQVANIAGRATLQGASVASSEAQVFTGSDGLQVAGTANAGLAEASVLATRDNPTGSGVVGDIDFRVDMIPQPR